MCQRGAKLSNLLQRSFSRSSIFIVLNDDGMKERTGIGGDAILKLLKICMTMTDFRFRNKQCALAVGLPMGSPALPVIANIHMKVFEDKAWATFTPAKPKVLYRLVDNVFSMVKGDMWPNYFTISTTNIHRYNSRRRRREDTILDVEVNRTKDSHLSMNTGNLCIRRYISTIYIKPHGQHQWVSGSGTF